MKIKGDKVICKSTHDMFIKEADSKFYTIRWVSPDEFSILNNSEIKWIEIRDVYPQNRIVKEIIDITHLGDLFGKMLVGIGWKDTIDTDTTRRSAILTDEEQQRFEESYKRNETLMKRLSRK